jgi:dimethylglycine dehydrogenase
VLTHALGENGRYQTEFTITRLASDRFYLLSASTAQLRDGDLLAFAQREDEDVVIRDITMDYSVLIVAGPRSRDLLAKLTDQDLTNASFRWLNGKEIEVAGVPVRALRVNYVGELGWELHVPMARVVELYDAVWAAGEEFGVADFGMYAMNSLRIEKAYAGFGVELTNEITPVEAAMERFVRLDKAFRGKEAVLAAKEREPRLKMCYVEVNVQDADVAGGEPVFHEGQVIGLTTSGGYGYTVQKSLAFAYVRPQFTAPGTTFEIEILGECCAATVLAEPAYDPKNARLKA